jgi:hypothetical protein
VNGVLEGKASADADLTGMATLYAVSKNDATEVHFGKFYYSVYYVDPFEYCVNGAGWIDASVDGYVAVSNSDVMKIEIREQSPSVQGSYTVTLAMSGETEMYEFDDGVIWLNVPDDPDMPSFKDYTGVIQLHIVRAIDYVPDFESTLHVMLVGPVVHSGLNPVVLSS